MPSLDCTISMYSTLSAKGCGCSSVVEFLRKMFEALGSVLSTEKQKQKQQKNCQARFQSGCTLYIPTSKVGRSSSQHPSQPLALSVWFKSAFLILTLICISLMPGMWDIVSYADLCFEVASLGLPFLYGDPEGDDWCWPLPEVPMILL